MTRYSSTTDSPYQPDPPPDTRPILMLCDQIQQLRVVMVGMDEREGEQHGC